MFLDVRRLSPGSARLASLRTALATVTAALAFSSPAPSVMTRSKCDSLPSATNCS